MPCAALLRLLDGIAAEGLLVVSLLFACAVRAGNEKVEGDLRHSGYG